MKKEDYDPRKAMSLETIIASFPPEQEIICLECGKKHYSDEKTFYTFYGNVTIGLYGGLIGNNLSEDGTIGRISFLCRTEECLEGLTRYLMPIEEMPMHLQMQEKGRT